MERLFVFDTTLRDGEQAPGFGMDRGEKLRVARAIAALGVDVIEAGFPAASPEDHAAVEAIAREIGGTPDAPTICALARCTPGDIEAAASALAPAQRRRIHVFLATSDLHLEAKLGITREEALRRIAEGVRHARRLADDVEFSPEDASRSDPRFLAEAVQTAIHAGAGTINLPDTVGYGTPETIADMVRSVLERVPEANDIVLSVHCHDDLGLATANSLAAVAAGARQVECTVNGIGERAGNAALEEVVMALRTHSARFGVETGIDTKRIAATAQQLAHVTGIQPPPNKAIVGANAFSHESGIHQHGVLSDRSTYEVLRAEDVGRQPGGIVLGRHSGKHALLARIAALGIDLEPDDVEPVFERFKELASQKPCIDDGDLFALTAAVPREIEGAWRLISMHATGGTGLSPSATVELDGPHGRRRVAAVGDGVVDAALRAIVEAAGAEVCLEHFRSEAAGPGADAQCEARVLVSGGGRTVPGRGLSTDTVEAAARAFVDALCRLPEETFQPIQPAAAVAAAR